MTLKIRKVQREDQSILLVVHDRSGNSHDLIEKTTLYLSEMIRQESTNDDIPDNKEEVEDEIH
jgi:hypothetical protein